MLYTRAIIVEDVTFADYICFVLGACQVLVVAGDSALRCCVQGIAGDSALRCRVPAESVMLTELF